MRLSIRWKLMLSIGIPLLGVYAILLWADYRDMTEAAKNRTRLHLTEVVKEHAARLEGELNVMAQVARSTAAILEHSEPLSAEQIDTILRINATTHPMVHGARVAFEPGGGYPTEIRHVLTAQPNRVIVQSLDEQDYRLAPWYNRVLRYKRAIWTETMSAGDDERPQFCVYAQPYHVDGRIRGVVTIDISLAKLREHFRQNEFEWADMSLVSAGGRYISHRSDEFVEKKSVYSTGEVDARQEVKDLLAALGTHQAEYREINGFPEKGLHLIFFAPIRSTGWSFMVTARESTVMAPVYEQMKKRPLIHMAGFLAILGVVFVASMRITAPVLSLADGVAQISRGNLDASIDTVRSHDELGDLSMAFNKMVVDLKDQMRKLETETATRERVQSELRVGREIQTALLPSSFPDHKAFELTAVNIPAKEMAGDFYDFFFTDDNLMTLVVADVSGKGVPAALFMAVSRTIVRNLALSGLGPAQIIQQANDALLQENSRGLFVTIWVGQYNIDTGEMTYCNGGHPPPFVLHKSGNVDIFGEVTAPLVGVIDPEMFGMAEERTQTLEPGDILLIYTDGIPEAISPEGEFLGDARFRRLVSDLAGNSVGGIVKLAIEQIDTFVANTANDDRTLVILQRS